MPQYFHIATVNYVVTCYLNCCTTLERLIEFTNHIYLHAEVQTKSNTYNCAYIIYTYKRPIS